MTLILLTAVLTLATSAGLTALMRRVAIFQGMIDNPNARSSHCKPTPRGGGVAIVLSSLGGLLALNLFGWVPNRLLIEFAGGLSIAVIGLLDDNHSLSAATRLAVQVAVALWVLYWVGEPAIFGASTTPVERWLTEAIALVGLIWTLNLFNFMDGIDGIAASETIFIAVAGALLTRTAHGSTAISTASLVIAAASAGFLPWNWPPAKIFMGDVGSGYIGYAIAVLALTATLRNPSALWVWLILGGVFYTDATVTLIRRGVRGERIHEAHRIHAYQWLARRWGSHRRVTLAVTAVNLVWLLPWACLAAKYPEFAVWMTLGALGPLVAVALAAGAGRAEISLR